MKNIQIISFVVAALLIFIGLIFYTNSANYTEETTEVTSVETEATIENDEVTVVETPTQPVTNMPETTVPAPINIPTPTAPEPETITDSEEVEELKAGDRVKDYFANAMQCEWYDPVTQNYYNAMIKDDNVRLETKFKDMTAYAIYTDISVSVWEKDESEGFVVPYSSSWITPMLPFRTRGEVFDVIETHDRVTCDTKSFNDTHFSPPRNVVFTSIDS